MLRIAAPHVDAWNSWYADIKNTPSGVSALRDRVDEACRDVGRDPAAIERTVAVFVALTGGTGRIMGDTDRRELVKPLSGGPDAIAAELRKYAAEGIAEVQLVIDPINRAAIDELAPALELLDQG
jgi:alkanesulfonate monooxygenase SsuD/methylene tetrahydromethanopterin reductase-like flavin-dependent oxidoreductase (luciferase family)